MAVKSDAAKPFPFPWLMLWALGSITAAARFAIGAARTAWILRRATPADYAWETAEEMRSAIRTRRRVTVLETADVPVPLACGILRPIVLLPRGAREWPEARLRTVLRHELAHISRYDLAAQALAQGACCLHWFNPLAWMAAGKLREERERACDDVVLASGTAAHEYAADLVDLARGLAARRRVWVDTPAMAEASGLEPRIRSLFDPARNRQPLRARGAIAIGVALLALLAPVASLTLYAQAAHGALAGRVADPSGARVPRCLVTAKNRSGTNQEVTKTNAAGEFRFAAIPPGDYALEFGARGFGLTINTKVIADQATTVDVTLQMGTVSEWMTVSGERPPAAAPRSGTPQRVRVGGNVQPLKLLHQTRPAYPAELQQLGVQGTVVIRAVISLDGSVLSPQVVNTDIDPRLARLALEAVKQWRYQPALLNGEPVETATTVTIDFTVE
jgi:TonB family protein